MIRTIHYASLAILAITVVVFLIPYISTRQDVLFLSFTISLIAAIVSRMALDSKAQHNE